MAFLKLHRERKAASCRAQKLRNKLESCKASIQRIEEQIEEQVHAEKKRCPNASWNELIARDKRAAVDAIASIEPDVVAWKRHWFNGKDGCPPCSAPNCQTPPDSSILNNTRYCCVFDLNGEYSFCHDCLSGLNFDTDFMISETVRLKKAYLEAKRARPYMQAAAAAGAENA